MRAALQHDTALLSAAPWFTEDWLDRVLAEAPQEFDRAFDRWRELYRAATQQLLEATQALLKARKAEDQQRANRLQQEALRQRNLLLQIDVQREESDFYPYRYLASEGFLPGYNFPALPVRAWVPRGEGEFIARPRALALREFAPGNIIYHEGAKWEVMAFQAPPGGLDERRRRQRLCYTCGAFCEPTLDAARPATGAPATARKRAPGGTGDPEPAPPAARPGRSLCRPGVHRHPAICTPAGDGADVPVSGERTGSRAHRPR